MAKKDGLIKALLKKGRHSPAGARYLAKKKKRTQPIYFKGIKKPTAETQLREAKMDEKLIKKMVGAKNYVGP